MLQSNRIRIETSDPAQSDFHIKGVVNPTSCSILIEDVKWKKSDLINCIANSNNLTKTISDGIWDGGSASWNTVALNGYFQFTTSENNKGKAAGLSVTNTNALNTSILYAFLLTANGELRITESGTDRGIVNTYVAGDLLRMSVETVAGVNRVRYYKNGVLIYTSTLTATTLPMLVDASLYNIGSTINQATVGNLNSGSFTASTLNMGTPTYRWYLNGSLVQNGTSNTYTNASITNLDQVYCIATPGLNGCSNTSINSNNTVFNGSFITVTNPPAVCEPNTVDLTAPGITVGTGPDMALTYWLDAAATIPMPAPTLATAGTYYIKGVRRGACTDIKPVTVTVNPSPTASITSASGNQITCATSSINLTIAGTGSYLWDNGLTTATRTVNSAGTYIASVTSASGCTRTTTFTVFQNTVPPVMYINGNTSPICQGATVNLQAVPSIFNNAMRLDGVAQYASPGDWFNYQNFTIEMWLRAGSSQTPSATILDNNHLPGVRSWVVQQNAGNANQYQFICYNTQGASATASFSLTANVWQHVTLVKSPSALLVYINGTQTTSIPWTLGAIKYDNSQLLRIGKWGGGTRFWNGQIDELRIFAKDISAARISADMNSWFPSVTDDLIAAYKFDEPDNSLFISNATNYVTGNAPVYGGANFITSTIPLSSTYSYGWNPGGSTSNAISFIPTGTQIYNATVTGVNGCSNIDTTEISVSLNGVATVTGSTPGCQNTVPATITITGSGAIAPYTFYYTVNGVPTSSTTPLNSSSVTIQVPNTATGTFLYDINNLTYANASFCLQAQTAQASITVNPEPLINSITDGFRCDSGVVNLSATSAASINWFTTPTGGTPVFTGTNYTTPSLTASAIYYVSALSAQGCSSSVRTPVDAVVEYPGMWMGYTSDWGTPFNWGCSTLPTSTTNVTIPTTPIGNFFPIVNSAGISVCGNIAIQTGASVTINSGRNLSIYGNISNNGIANWGTGEIRLLGNIQQQIGGSSSQTMGRLLVNNTTNYNAIKLLVDLTIEQQINFIDGVIDLNSRTLTLGTTSSNGTTIGQSVASYVRSNNGFMRIRTNTNSTYPFPVGDSLYYTPYTLQLNSGAAAGSDIRVKVVNASHPNLS
ncbi:MAG: LamG-like jellyroll fold domain-containing protein, partial [Bacteroidota bacterium]